MEQAPIRIFTEDFIKSNLRVGKLYQINRPAILLVKKGQANISLQINTIDLTANSVVLFDEETIYEIHSYSDDFEVQVILYTNNFIEKLGLKLNKLKVFKHFKTHIHKITHLPNQEFIMLWKQVHIMDNILLNKASLNYSEDIVDHLFSALVYSLAGSLLKQQENTNNKMSRQEEITFEFVKNVFENFKNEKSLQFYADLQNLTIRHLSSVVKSVTEKTANQIISEFVMNEAKILLNKKKSAIWEIANILQFSDPYSFSHFFKKHEGMSPMQYKAQSN